LSKSLLCPPISPLRLISKPTISQHLSNWSWTLTESPDTEKSILDYSLLFSSPFCSESCSEILLMEEPYSYSLYIWSRTISSWKTRKVLWSLCCLWDSYFLWWDSSLSSPDSSTMTSQVTLDKRRYSIQHFRNLFRTIASFHTHSTNRRMCVSFGFRPPLVQRFKRTQFLQFSENENGCYHRSFANVFWFYKIIVGIMLKGSNAIYFK
jgi:hypothetical protein